MPSFSSYFLYLLRFLTIRSFLVSFEKYKYFEVISEMVNLLMMSQMDLIHVHVNPLFFGPINVPISLIFTFFPSPVFQRVQYCIFKCSFKTHSCTFIFNYTNGRDNALFLYTFGNTLTFNLLNLNIIL